MMVTLRNKAGRICTLAQWCGERPSIEINAARFSETNPIEDMIKLAELQKIAQIAIGFELWETSCGVDEKKVKLSIHSSGGIAVCCSAQPGEKDRIKKAVIQAEAIVKNNVWRAWCWDSTEYEVPTL
jgi:hypothetical protein